MLGRQSKISSAGAYKSINEVKIIPFVGKSANQKSSVSQRLTECQSQLGFTFVNIKQITALCLYVLVFQPYVLVLCTISLRSQASGLNS